MRRSLTALVAVVITFFVVATPAFAADSSQTITALRSSPVYVEPDTPGTDSSTAAKINRQLNDNDHILIVVVPDALTSNAAQQLASQIDKAIKGTVAIGLYYDGGTLGYSSLYSTSDVNDLMTRAKTVSSNPSDAMVTYIQNVQQYVASQPKPVKPSSAKTSEQGSPIPGIVIGAVIACVIGVVIYRIIRRRTRSKRYTKGVNPGSAPRDLRLIISELRDIRKEVIDRKMVKSIDDVCELTEAYFQRSDAKGAEREREIRTFDEYLKTLKSVLVKYLDVLNNPRFYPSPSERYAEAQEAVDSLGSFVLNQIRRGNTVSDTDYSVNTKILRAAKY